MEKSLRHLPRELAADVIVVLHEVAEAVIAVQTPSGRWHTLLHHAPHESRPDTSGTALIAFHLSRAYQGGFLTGARYHEAAEKAFAALPLFVRADGVVESASPGPGPLQTEEPWLVPSFPPDDPHGTFAVLFAAAH